MTTKYHLNPETGVPGVCKANKRDCKFGSDTKHFDTKEAAVFYYEETWSKNYDINSVSPNLKAVSKKSMNNDLKLSLTDLANYYDARARLVEKSVYGVTAPTPEKINSVIERYSNGERIIGDKAEIANSEDRLLWELSNPDESSSNVQQLYLSTVFPVRDLAPKLEEAELIGEVRVRHFFNTRENGFVYTVDTPDGNTRSFCVYEHRNSDHLIINGTANWNEMAEPDDPDNLPYAGESKYNVLHSETCGRFEDVSVKLVDFLKRAHNGTLESNMELLEKHLWR